MAGGLWYPIQNLNNGGGSAKGDNRLDSCSNGVYSLKFLRIDAFARRSNQSKLEGDFEMIGSIGTIAAHGVFEHFGEIVSVEHVLCDF